MASNNMSDQALSFLDLPYELQASIAQILAEDPKPFPFYDSNDTQDALLNLALASKASIAAQDVLNNSRAFLADPKDPFKSLVKLILDHKNTESPFNFRHVSYAVGNVDLKDYPITKLINHLQNFKIPGGSELQKFTDSIQIDTPMSDDDEEETNTSQIMLAAALALMPLVETLDVQYETVGDGIPVLREFFQVLRQVQDASASKPMHNPWPFRQLDRAIAWNLHTIKFTISDSSEPDAMVWDVDPLLLRILHIPSLKNLTIQGACGDGFTLIQNDDEEFDDVFEKPCSNVEYLDLTRASIAYDAIVTVVACCPKLKTLRFYHADMSQRVNNDVLEEEVRQAKIEFEHMVAYLKTRKSIEHLEFDIDPKSKWPLPPLAMVMHLLRSMPGLKSLTLTAGLLNALHQGAQEIQNIQLREHPSTTSLPPKSALFLSPQLEELVVRFNFGNIAPLFTLVKDKCDGFASLDRITLLYPDDGKAQLVKKFPTSWRLEVSHWWEYLPTADREKFQKLQQECHSNDIKMKEKLQD